VKQVKAYAPGIYARSEELVQATRDHDRSRTTGEAVERQQTTDVEDFLAAQREAGFDYHSDGLLNWQDIFRPFDSVAEDMKPGPLTRFLNTNTFYRAPAVAGEKPRLNQPLGEPHFRIGDLPQGRWVATLPSPYALAKLAAGEIKAKEAAENVLRPQIEHLAGQGCAFVVLQETSIFDGDVNFAELGEALEALQDTLPVALQLPFGDSGELLPELVKLPVEAIGVDFYSTDVDALPRPFPRTLLAGVIDARNSLLEDPSEVSKFGMGLLEGLEDGRDLHLVPNGDLQFVPQTIAREKVLRLGQAARALREG